MGILRKTQGSVLLASVIVTIMLIAVIVQFTQVVIHNTRSSVRYVAGQKARMSADSGLQSALQFLRSPQASILQAGIPRLVSSVEQGTTFYLSLTRQLSDPSLVDVNATGYYQLTNGAVEAPGGNYRAQAYAIYAQVQLRNIGDYFAASPETLTIGYGSDISSGSVYARDLVFQTGSGPRTRVKSAAYFNSISPANYSNYVTFLDENQPSRLASEPVLPTLGAGLRNQYQSMAGGAVLAAGSTLAGMVDPPTDNEYRVYFSPGDITLGAVNSSCTARGSFLLYSQGDIHIANTINRLVDSTAWIALMAEGNIVIDQTAPNDLSIEATLVTNGTFEALGAYRSNGKLTMTGGMVTGHGVSIGNVYGESRVYTFRAPDPNLPLPFATQVIIYKVLQGKYD
jgi:hypothetical protein